MGTPNHILSTLSLPFCLRLSAFHLSASLPFCLPTSLPLCLPTSSPLCLPASLQILPSFHLVYEDIIPQDGSFQERCQRWHAPTLFLYRAKLRPHARFWIYPKPRPPSREPSQSAEIYRGSLRNPTHKHKVKKHALLCYVSFVFIPSPEY